MFVGFMGNFGIFSSNQIDKWSTITHDRLLDVGFIFYEKGVFSGKSEYVKDTYNVPHIDNNIADRFVFDANRSCICDYKWMLPEKHCSSMFDIKEYIRHSKYFDS